MEEEFMFETRSLEELIRDGFVVDKVYYVEYNYNGKFSGIYTDRELVTEEYIDNDSMYVLKSVAQDYTIRHTNLKYSDIINFAMRVVLINRKTGEELKYDLEPYEEDKVFGCRYRLAM